MSDPRLNDPLRNPGSIDPNDPKPNQDYLASAQARAARGSGMMWGWIAGIAVVVLIVAFMFGGMNNSQQTANQSSPVTRTAPATTGTAQTNPGSPSPNLGTTTNGSGSTTGTGTTSGTTTGSSGTNR